MNPVYTLTPCSFNIHSDTNHLYLGVPCGCFLPVLRPLTCINFSSLLFSSLLSSPLLFLHSRPDRLWNPTSLLVKRKRVSFPWVQRPGRKVSTRVHLVPTLRMSGAIPHLPLYAFMAWTGTVLSFTRTCRVHRPSNPPWYDYPNNVWQGHQDVMLQTLLTPSESIVEF